MVIGPNCWVAVVVVCCVAAAAEYVIASETAVETFDAESLNWAYTVFVPSPEDRVHDFDVAYVSHVPPLKAGSLEIIICAASVADKVRVTAVELVVVAPALILTDVLVGGVVSTGATYVPPPPLVSTLPPPETAQTVATGVITTVAGPNIISPLWVEVQS